VASELIVYPAEYDTCSCDLWNNHVAVARATIGYVHIAWQCCMVNIPDVEHYVLSSC